VLVMADGQLWIAVELKSQAGPSFGNNYNNRIEEALGNATDIRTAHAKEDIRNAEAVRRILPAT
jgi:hypothetical protein